MRILVTGHLGYIGVVLTPMLLSRGHDVVGLDTDLYRRCTFESGGPIARVPNIDRDIRDVDAGDLEGFAAVIHLAGLSNDPLGDLDPELTMEINHRASVRLAELSKRAGVPRFIFSSSCSNYGAAGDDLLDEQAAFNPVTPYGKSKVLVERDVAALTDDRFSPVFLRNATACGVSARLRFDLVLNNLTAWAYTTGKVFIKSDGTPWRPIVHVQDIARAFAAVAEAPRDKVHAQAYNICASTENYRVRDLAQIVQREIPGSTVEFAQDASPDKRNYRVSGAKFAEAFPEHAPRWTAERTAAELHRAFGRAGLEAGEFEGPRYKRVAHLKMLLEQGLLNPSFRPAGL